MSALRRLARHLMSNRVLTAPFTLLARDQAIILRMHRFRDSERGVPGRDPEGVRAVLDYLRGEGYEFLALDELIRRAMGQGPPPGRALAVTIDDGYYDQARIAAPLFAEFDCPATIFVTTGFLDGKLWNWWDKIEYVFARSERSEIRLGLDERSISYRRGGNASWGDAGRDFTERCKRVGEETKHDLIARLAAAAEVELPERPPAEYAPMSWEDVRACEERGMRFGPHTVTHPILARASAEESRREIADSWARLCQEARHPVPVFAYPNGRRGDYGAREIEILKSLGFLGAVTTRSGYVGMASLRRDPDARFTLKRFGNADSLHHVIGIVRGFERVRQLIVPSD